MPCMGPNVDYAEEQAKLAFEEIATLLQQKYHIYKSKGEKDRCLIRLEQKSKENWSSLEKVITTLFVDDCIHSF